MIDNFISRLGKLVGDDISPREIAWLFAHWQHPVLYSTRRAGMILTRVRLVAMVFAILTPAWMIIDYWLFPLDLFWKLATARIIAAAAFARLATCPIRCTDMQCARASLIFMFAIPTVFFLFSYWVVSGYELTGYSAAVAAGYGFLPFAMLSGIAIFPLTIIECAMFATPMLGAQALAGMIEWNALEWPSFAGAFWLLLVITAVATLASTSQLALMIVLVRQVMRDPLTGAFSRSSGEELLAIQDAAIHRADGQLAIAFVDLDHFKTVNDNFGHEAGDSVLRKAAEQLRGGMRRSDVVVRWGGEEFVVVMPDTSVEAAVAVLQRLREQGFGKRPDGAPVTASIGVAERRADAITDWRALVELADQRMYHAKQQGRDRIVADRE